MNFEKHSDLKDKHAFLSASKYHWINYDEERLVEAYATYGAALRGTVIHNFAAQCITLKQKLPRSSKTLNMYVNDAIGFRMTPEQTLYYSRNCFGTADAISFQGNVLRIHDLKTGVNPGHMEQLMIYAALFCLEYRIDPKKIDIILRIYQFDDIEELLPDPDDILIIMDKITLFDTILSKIQVEEG